MGGALLSVDVSGRVDLVAQMTRPTVRNGRPALRRPEVADPMRTPPPVRRFSADLQLVVDFLVALGTTRPTG
jgi:hypothetical protein